ncbi:DUF4169 family protein [Aurantimonas sp. A2-1-M11]|uniref:DUF4169 family protein n=1 Tax=Aurantimonas sp. A2-1-M11 TaxID=3113712 RepID=UPI002F9220E4
MAEIVNLRLTRKRKAREAAARDAEDNRLRHGTPKAMRQSAGAERADAARKLDGAKRERRDTGPSGTPNDPPDTAGDPT